MFRLSSRRTSMHFKHFLFVVFAVFLSGCATIGQPQFNVFVDSLASPEAKEKRTYLLLPGNEGATWDDLQFQEYAVYVMRMLEMQGFVPAREMEEADVAIVLSYGIGDPQATQYSYTLPMWGKTGISSSKTYGNATTYGNTISYSGTTTHTPSYGITGYSTHIGTAISYFRYALISGYDLEALRESERQIQLWKTTITSTGSSGDLRQVFPVLIGASAPYIARNSGRRISVQLYENDKAVKAIKGELIKK